VLTGDELLCILVVAFANRELINGTYGSVASSRSISTSACVKGRRTMCPQAGGGAGILRGLTRRLWPRDGAAVSEPVDAAQGDPSTNARKPIGSRDCLATGLRHLATSKWGTLREAIRRTDRPQKHSIADERALAG
jgi:hypothetical protein